MILYIQHATTSTLVSLSAKLLEQDHDASRNLHEEIKINGGHVHGQSIHDAAHGVLVKKAILGVSPWCCRSQSNAASGRNKT